MLAVDHQKKELHCKVVYYGPGLAGKVSNVVALYNLVRPEFRSKLVTHKTDIASELTFHFPAGRFKTPKGYGLHFHLFSVPGAVWSPTNQKMILENVDGVIFVADSQPERIDADLDYLTMLKENLQALDIDFQTLPYVLQLNKRDIPGILSVEDLATRLRCKNEPVFEAVAFKGIGVIETFKALARQILRKYHPVD
ncbi:MAG TPA: GTPase domain-containing protein [Acidobacteriota bacterium]|nr:GTPase domain-containing protein [Acidobacteriota bacterium]